MNNTKVRIYDLARELKRENRDILKICEELNIAFKSHSSTITESEAERVKAMAKNFSVSQSPKKRKKKAGKTIEKKKETKQQILVVHHKQMIAEDSEIGDQSELIAPPETTASNLLNAPPSKPTLASPPLSRPASSQKTKPTTTTPSPEKVVSQSLSSTPSAPASPPRSPKGSTASDQAVSLKPLVPPPVKPSKIPPITSRPSPPPQAESAPEAVVASPSPKLITPPRLQTNSPSTAEPPTAPHKPESEASDSIETLDLNSGLLTKKKIKSDLKRPVLPRQERLDPIEDDQDKVETKQSKNSSKGKRRHNRLDDDDDDVILAEMNSNATTASSSLSTARPPKPKSLAKQTTTKTSKPKKAPTKPERPKTEPRDQVQTQKRPESILLDHSLTVRDLADLLHVAETEIIKALFFQGIAVNITQTLDLETARLVAEQFDVLVETSEETAAAAKTTEMLDISDLENLQLRPPVVTIMGHVDHGKTTLLDSIRETKVAQGEAGGITQHIGAYHVDIEHEGKQQQIVFLDTPGHEAFTAMRARGAKVTDIAILVVAADDGVRPQTQEAISHAKAAEVPLIVAINKIDKAGANPDRVKQELSELGLVPEDWGGETIMVPVSALKGENLDNLLEMLLIVAEFQELSANPDRPARGTVIEAHLDRTRGPVASLLVQNGTLKVGDIVVAGSVFGKIRAMIDDRGKRVEAAQPSFAVEILGLNEVPAAGEEFEVLTEEKEARVLAESRAQERHQTRLQQAMSSRRVTLSTLSAQAQEGELKELNLILKADVQGSVEAILGSLQQLPQDQVQIRVLLSAAGEVTETDVDLAAASGAVIIGFNTSLASGARQAADHEGVDIREYDIIYKLLDDIQGAMEGLLEPEEVESSLGQVEVRAVFPVGRNSVAGCYVLSGRVVRNRNLRVKRDDKIIYEGMIDSLKRMKEDVREVNAGFECGIGVTKFNDWQEGDLIEVYEMVMKRRTLNS